MESPLLLDLNPTSLIVIIYVRFSKVKGFFFYELAVKGVVSWNLLLSSGYVKSFKSKVILLYCMSFNI